MLALNGQMSSRLAAAFIMSSAIEVYPMPMQVVGTWASKQQLLMLFPAPCHLLLISHHSVQF